MDKCLHACGSSRENLQVFSDSFHQEALWVLMTLINKVIQEKEGIAKKFT